MKDTIQHFARVKRQLTDERNTLSERLAAINAVLGNVPSPTAPQPQSGSVAKAAVNPSQRRTGKLTLAQAILNALGVGGGEKGNGKSIKELLPIVRGAVGKTHKVTRPIVTLSCLRLLNQRQVKRVDRGVYALR